MKAAPELKPTVRENIYTFPNVLTVSRILACPLLAWSIVDGHFAMATGILAYAGFTDWVCASHPSLEQREKVELVPQLDGYIARRYNMRTVLGTILDPAADKALVTTLTVTLAMSHLLPGSSIPGELLSVLIDLICSAAGDHYYWTRRLIKYFSVLLSLHLPSVASKSKHVLSVERSLTRILENVFSILGLFYPFC